MPKFRRSRRARTMEGETSVQSPMENENAILVSRTIEYSNLPDSIWLDILSNLDLKTLSIVARCSRHFYRLCSDKALWERVDFSLIKNITLSNLHTFLRTPHAKNVKCLQWEGFMRRFCYSNRNARRPSQNEAMTVTALESLANNCPNLIEFRLIYGDIKHLKLTDFPSSLKFLSFEGSIVSFEFFGDLSNPNVLRNLIGLDVSNVHNLSSFSKSSVQSILGRNSLKFFRVRNCFKLSCEDVLNIPVRLNQLRSLNVSDMSYVVDNEFCRRIGQNCRELRDLDLSFCHKVTEEGIKFMVVEENSYSPIRRLTLIECHVSVDVLKYLSKIPNLEYVNLIKTKASASVEDIDRFVESRPKCRVVRIFSETAFAPGSSFWICDPSVANDDDNDLQQNNMQH